MRKVGLEGIRQAARLKAVAKRVVKGPKGEDLRKKSPKSTG
jgi:hypothetical protein